MFDLKVVTAVFVTLLGIAIGMSQGAVERENLTEMTDLLNDIRGAPGKIFDSLSGKTDMEASISFTLELNEVPSFEKNFPKDVSKVEINYDNKGSEVFLNDAQLSSNKENVLMYLENFRGSLDLHEKMDIKGSAQYASLGDYNFNSSSLKVRTEDLNANHMTMKEIPTTTFNFDDAQGKIALEKSDINLMNESLRIVGFEGDMKADFIQNKFTLEGKSAEVFVGGEQVTIKISD